MSQICFKNPAPSPLRGLLAVLAALLCLWCQGCNGDESGDEDRGATSLLFITIDTLRADRLGCTGRNEAVTPVLDSLARQGALSDRLIVSAPITLPSHATLLTGRLPHELGVRDNRPFAVSDETETLAEILAAREYQTAAVVSGEPLDAGCGLEQGFERYRFRPEPRRAKVLLRESPADRTVDTAIELAGELDPSRPFFLWIHFFDPHHPYIAPIETPSGDDYDNEVAFVDREIGRLLGRLEARGFMKKTVVAIVSDHGEGLGDHGESTHAYFLFDTTIRVPLLVKGPGIKAGKRPARQIRGQDLTGALLLLLGQEKQQTSRGSRELAAWLSKGTDLPVSRPAFTESLFCNSHFHWAQLASLRTDEAKVIRGARTEIIEIGSDRGETAPIASSDAPPQGRDLMSRLSDMLSTMKTPVHEPARRMIGSLPGYLGSTASGSGPFLEREENAKLPHPPDHADRIERFLGAVSHNQSGLVNQARTTLEELVAEDPNNPSFHFWLGRTLRALAEKENSRTLFARAHECFAASLKLDENFSDAFHMSAWCLLRLGRFEEARAALDSRLDREPKDPKSLELYGYLLTTPASEGIKNPYFDLDAGLLFFRRSIDLNENNPGLLQNLVALYNSFDKPEMVAKYRAILERVLRGETKEDR